MKHLESLYIHITTYGGTIVVNNTFHTLIDKTSIVATKDTKEHQENAHHQA